MELERCEKGNNRQEHALCGVAAAIPHSTVRLGQLGWALDRHHPSRGVDGDGDEVEGDDWR